MSTQRRVTRHPGYGVAPHVPTQPPDPPDASPDPPAWLSRATAPPPISPADSLPQVSLSLLASLTSEQVLISRRIEAMLDQLVRALMRLPERKPVAHPLAYDPDRWPSQDTQTRYRTAP